ncbi:MAG: M28 family peptidase [Spirochaetales bacterium]|nr:M28 family peptidase [Spirochaetales bacterium]MCF7939182.1 M28 family peptidase [Spirochaetales bacterium]
MAGKHKKLMERIPEYEERIRALGESVLANLVMVSEIPAPTFHERARMDFLLHRFNEYELINCSTDEVGNALGILPGTEGERNIIVVAHMDTIFSEEVDHTVSIQPNLITGPGVGDNGLGVAAMLSLPMLLEHLNIKLKSNLVLMGSSRSLGRGNIEGVRFFLGNTDLDISSGVCIEGVELGRLSYSSIGMLRGELTYRVPESYDWTRFGAGGVILNINEVINKILEIPLPRRPQTTIMLGSVQAGTGFDKTPTKAVLRFEIRSESEEQVMSLGQQIEDIAAEVASRTGAEVSFINIAQRRPGGIAFSHPLARTSRGIMKQLNIQPRISPSTSELSAFIDREIPAVTLGLTTGEDMAQPGESISLEPTYTGLTQLIALLESIDEGCCDES